MALQLLDGAGRALITDKTVRLVMWGLIIGALVWLVLGIAFAMGRIRGWEASDMTWRLRELVKKKVAELEAASEKGTENASK